MSITSSPFGTLTDDRPVEKFTLTHAGLRCCIMTYGGCITELHTPDRTCDMADIVLGLPSLADYEAGHPYLGVITGRVAGRINGGHFELDGEQIQLPLSQPPNHLHGGITGFDKKVWDAEPETTDAGEPRLILRYRSPAGEEGYPGSVSMAVTYTLTNDAALKIDYHAVTDAATPFNPTNHSYFNLAGEDSADTIADHNLQIFSDRIVKGDDVGTLADIATSVEGTPHDFREKKSLKDFMSEPNFFHGEQYLFEGGKMDAPRPVAVLSHPGTGRVMKVATSESGVQLYCGKFLNDSDLKGKSGHIYPGFGGICLECQGLPNAVNTPDLDNIILRPGTPYRHSTVYAFSVG